MDKLKLVLGRGVEFLWRARVTLISLAVVFLLGNLLYFLPEKVWLWIGLLLIWLFISALWWQRKWNGVLLRQLLKLLIFTLAFLGIAIFAVRSVVVFELVLMIYLLGLWYVAAAFYVVRREGTFRIKDLARLYWGELIALFFALVGIFSATAFFGLGLWAVMILAILSAGLIFYLFAQRQNLEWGTFWLYLGLLAVILGELLFLVFPWQRGVFFKAFLVFLVYFIYVEFIQHYLAGNLTLRLVLEQLVFGLSLLAALFLFDFILALI